MSKYTHTLRQESSEESSLGEKFGIETEKLLEAAVEPVVPTKIKRGKDIIDTVLYIKKLDAEAPPAVPYWQIVLAGTASTAEQVVTDEVLGKALATMVGLVMLRTGPIGAVALGIGYGGAVVIAHHSDSQRDKVAESILMLDTTGIVQSFKSKLDTVTCSP